MRVLQATDRRTATRSHPRGKGARCALLAWCAIALGGLGLQATAAHASPQASGASSGVSSGASESASEIGQELNAPQASNAPRAAREDFPPQERRTWRFEESDRVVLIDNEFSGARVNACARVGPFDYRIVTTPENIPINPSPWYSFRVRCEPIVAEGEGAAADRSAAIAERDVTFRIAIAHGKSRPWPRISLDGGPFERAPRERYEGSEGAKECVLRVAVGAKRVVVAANAMVGIGEIEGWTDGVSAQLGVRPREIGRSQGGREIRAFEFGARDARDRIVVIGRQHPPEVAGTVGFMRFIETLAAETDLARDFRARFRVLCVPLVNPDGVHEGNWRSTLGHVDANRDWHDFSQPETRAVRDAIATFASPEDARVRLLLDFHATAKDVFYVPPDEAPLEPPHFARDWLRAIQARFPDYAVESSATHNVSEWTFKRWAFETFGAPGITYELGSSTPFEDIGRIVPGAAEEAMRLLVDFVDRKDIGNARERQATEQTQPSPQSRPSREPVPGGA